jgi:hypothetical protein
MSQRTDPMYYEFDIRENKTKEVVRTRIFCWWTGEHSIAERRRMCDCQLGAFFDTPIERAQTWADFLRYGPSNNHVHEKQLRYLEGHTCDHKPSRKYTVTNAYLPGGDVIEVAA